MKIDIDSLSYDELLELSNKIVERLKFLYAMHTHKEMMQFSPGDQVSFEPPGRGKQFGTLVKYNKKTFTIITESGQKWNVSPHLLRKVKKIKGSKLITIPDTGHLVIEEKPIVLVQEIRKFFESGI